MEAESATLELVRPLSLADQGQDDSLVEGCRRGCVSSYETLYRLYGTRMKSLAFQLLSNRGDAEDAVQETFLKLYRSIESFSGQSSLATWMFRILVNTCRDEGRRRSRMAAQMAEMEKMSGPAPANPGLRLALARAMEQLPENQRMVFVMFEVEGLKHAEIASILEVPEGTSRSWLFEAKRELKRLLTEGR